MSDIYATSHFANYGKPDKQEQQRKRFIQEIKSDIGAHSSELKKYWKNSNNWRNLLVPASKTRRKEIILEYLDVDIIRTTSATDIDEAFELLNPYISSVSERALINFFENQDVVHKAIGAMKREKPTYGLTISALGQDILFWEKKMFKHTKCPSILWEENRIELLELPCEDDDHRADCKQYELDGESSWLDRENAKSIKIGLQRKKFMTDQAKLKELKFKAIGNLITALKKEPDYSYEKLTETLASIEWSHPEIYLKPDLVKLWKFTNEEKAFCEEYFEIYDVQVTEQGVFHALKQTERAN
jgi:hypothetical protein